MGTKSKVPQTHRTILFEEFTADPTKRLDIWLDPDATPDSEARNQKIDKQLEVASFKEFLEKFAPTVYEYFIQDGDGKITTNYTTDAGVAKQCGGVPMKIIDHNYYQMLARLYADKGSSGDANITFNADNIKEILTPQNEIKSVYSLRGRMTVLIRQLEEARANGQPTKFFKQGINKCLTEAKSTYQDSFIKFLPVAHDDLSKKIKMLDERIAAGETSNGSQQTGGTVKYGIPSFNSNGDVVLLPAKTQTVSNDPNVKLLGAGSDERVNQMMIEAVSASYDHAVQKSDVDRENDFTRNLVLSVYTTKAIGTPLDDMDRGEMIAMRDDLVQRKNTYEAILVQAKEAFSKTLVEVIQKILGVKIFFDHATIKGGDEGELSPKLLVANCKISDLLGDKVIEPFKNFIIHRGVTENAGNKIWFAIVPHVLGDYNQTAAANHQDNSGLPDWLRDDDDDQSDAEIDGVDFNSLKTFLKIMNDATVMTVFNFAPTLETTFAGIQAKHIEEMKKKLGAVNYEHAVFAYPNFTLMSECEIPISNAAGVPRIKVPNVYIDAAYVAAGLLVACQQPLYLKKHGLADRVDTETACVHVDLEDDALVTNLTTHFNLELAYTWDKSITEAINADQFGFAFCSNQKFNPAADAYLKNTYIMCARTLAKRGKYYQPIYRVLTKNFILTYIKEIFGSTIREDTLKRDLPKYTRDWKQAAQSNATRNNVNLILREGEDVTYDEPDYPKQFAISLNDDVEVLPSSTLQIVEK